MVTLWLKYKFDEAPVKTIHITVTEMTTQICCDCISQLYVNIYPLQLQD